MIPSTTKSIKSLSDSVRKVISEQEVASSEGAAKAAIPSAMRKVLADGYVLYYSAHSSHWNVEGSNFPQYHTFFEKIYSEVYEELDKIAEQIRTVNAYAPVSLKDVLTMSTITEASRVYDPKDMLRMLHVMNDKFIASIDAAYRIAEAAHEIGMSNYLQDLTDKQKKLGWMIAATIKGE
jgi:starvation-inducible DNA-binding protein